MEEKVPVEEFNIVVLALNEAIKDIELLKTALLHLIKANKALIEAGRLSEDAVADLDARVEYLERRDTFNVIG